MPSKKPIGPKKKKHDSEFQSYTYIKNELKQRGWDTKNPNRDPEGHLYTQHECLENPEIGSMLERLTPEYVVKLREDAFWVIEAKPSVDDLEEAYLEATEEYGERINKHKFIRAKVASGVAGNDIDRYVVKTGLWDESKKRFIPVVYDGREISSLLTVDLATKLIEQNSPVLKTYEINPQLFVDTAKYINEILHSASVPKEKRATVVASILLSMLGDTEPNYNEKNPQQFIDDINSRARNVLTRYGKRSFFQYIRIHPYQKRSAQLKFKEALVTTIFQLKKVDIKAAMKAGSDILGTFYETFLKYGNGAKDLGILLTPRQITEFAAEVMEIEHSDILFDPTCGTGGFLVSGFYRVKRKATKNQIEDFKRYGIYGIDRQPPVASLAIINMIFRGDGRDNIENDDCLGNALVRTTIRGHKAGRFVSRKRADDKKKVANKVMMNPPFALDAEDEKEYLFVDYALEQLEDGGLLFSVFPLAGMTKAGGYLNWRKRLVKSNTVLSVISLPADSFYPSTSEGTVALIVRKGLEHPKNQSVLWLKLRTDGYITTKGQRLPDAKAPNDVLRVQDTVRAFIHSPSMHVDNIPEFQKKNPIDFDDPAFELMPEAYLDATMPTVTEIQQNVDDSMRELIAFFIKTKRERMVLTS
jgi:type I restriction-modification system DNA methylase subunit